jgi:hypothetical protein
VVGGGAGVVVAAAIDKVSVPTTLRSTVFDADPET